jgi:hypothetical protein
VQSFVTLPYEKPLDLPPPWDGHDPRTPPSFVRHFLDRFTDPGDVVLDPFAGFGTTVVEADAMDRVAVGVEFERERVAFVRDRLPEETAATVRRGDALRLDGAAFDDLPTADCVLTSPPFATRHLERNPFENYAGESDYESYLDDLRRGFRAVATRLRPGAPLLVDVANMRPGGEGVTTLAWDVADRLAGDHRFRGEVVVGWEENEGDDGTDRAARDGAFGYGYDHSYCLVFEAVADGDGARE